MRVTEALQQDMASIRQALSMTTLRQANNQDAATMGKLIESMEETSEAIRRSVEPHKGNNVNVKV